MVTCVVLIESSDRLNVSIIRDNRLLANYIGDLPISHFINEKVDCLKVIFKPTLCNFVPENGYKLGSVKVNNINKDCVISYEDFNNLSSFCSKVDSIEVYNYLDVCKNLFSNNDKVLVVDSWSKSLASVLYLEYGNIVDFKRVKYNKLPSVVHKMSDKYGYFGVVNANDFYDIMSLKMNISNIDRVPKERLNVIKHLAFCLENSGISVLEQEDNYLGWSSNDNHETSDSYYFNKINEEDFEVESDLSEDELTRDDYESNNKPRYSEEDLEDDLEDLNDFRTDVVEDEFEKPLGFFSRLFGKKKSSKNTANKSFTVDDEDAPKGKDSKSFKMRSKRRTNSRFSDYEYEDEDSSHGENSFSQLAVGEHKSSRSANGYVRERNMTGADYAFYVSFILFISLAVIFGGLQFIYKEKVGTLSNSYSSAMKIKNQMKTSVNVLGDPSNSPTVKVSQIKNMALPNTYKLEEIVYDGVNYNAILRTSLEDNVDSFSSYLPEGLVLSGITEKSSDGTSRKYNIVLVSA